MATRKTATTVPADEPADLSSILGAAHAEAAGEPQPEQEPPIIPDPQNPGGLSKFKPGSKELEALLASGYGMDRQQAETIIRERQQNPALYPYEVYKKAQAFLEALNATPQVVATNKGWNRTAE